MSNNNKYYENHYTQNQFTYYQIALEDLEYTRHGIEISPRNTVTNCAKFLEMILKYYMELRWRDNLQLSNNLKIEIQNETKRKLKSLFDFYDALFYTHNIFLLMESVDIVGLTNYEIFLRNLSKAYTVSKYTNNPTYIYTKQHAREIFDECEKIFNIIKQNIDYFESNNHSTQGLDKIITPHRVNNIFINIKNDRSKANSSVSYNQYIENTKLNSVTEDDLITHKTTENDTECVNQPKPPTLNTNFGNSNLNFNNSNTQK